MSVQSEREEYYALAKISLQLMVALMHTLQSTLSNLTQLLEGGGGRGGEGGREGREGGGGRVLFEASVPQVITNTCRRVLFLLCMYNGKLS